MAACVEEINLALRRAMDQGPYETRKAVFGEGPVQARLMMIGEAPGGEEEKLGRPFVGKAGKNLDEFMALAGIRREEIYLSNVVKIRPFRLSPKTGKPVNRPPSGEEIRFFLPFLLEEIQTVNPALIVTLGNVPLKAVTGNPAAAIGQCHGRLLELGTQKLFPLYHPASIIYNQSLKETYYEDLEKIKAYIR